MELEEKTKKLTQEKLELSNKNEESKTLCESLTKKIKAKEQKIEELDAKIEEVSKKQACVQKKIYKTEKSIKNLISNKGQINCNANRCN